MMSAKATNFYRKSGVAQWRDLRFLLLFPARDPTPKPEVIMNP
jgi:hypothetical protein